MPCDSGPATDIGVLMGKCMVPRYDRVPAQGDAVFLTFSRGENPTKSQSQTISVCEHRGVTKSKFSIDAVGAETL